jgi:hypothetical protein
MEMLKRTNNLGFIVEEPEDRPAREKEILWPNPWGLADDRIFPELEGIKARRSSKRLQPLVSFIQAAAEARERIWLLDDYLLKPSGESDVTKLDQVLAWFPEGTNANDIRLLTKSAGEAVDKSVKSSFDERTKLINSFSRNGLCKIEIRFTLQQNFPFVHDRFGIIDDELWHFGAAAGGLHHLVNATSRGWSATDHGAVEFFCLAWDHEEKVAKRK